MTSNRVRKGNVSQKGKCTISFFTKFSFALLYLNLRKGKNRREYKEFTEFSSRGCFRCRRGAHVVICIFIPFLSNQSVSHRLTSTCETTIISRLTANLVMDPSLKSIKGSPYSKIEREKSWKKLAKSLK